MAEIQEFNINNIINTNGRNTDEALDDLKIIDNNWIKSRFMVTDEDLSKEDAKFRYSSSAEVKFTDATLGGNIGINPRPQFTRYADMRVGGRLYRDDTAIGIGGNLGMGRYYSESIDDNAQITYLSFGIPRFNNLFTFMSGAIDASDTIAANTGRAPVGYAFGQFIGQLIMLAAFPYTTIIIGTLKTIYRTFFGNDLFNYYYMESTPHLYWSSVSTIVTQLSTELGLLAPTFMDDAPKEKVKDSDGNTNIKSTNIGFPVHLYQEDLDEISKLLPNIIDSKTNYIDMFAIATKTQRLANMQNMLNQEQFRLGNIDPEDFRGSTVPGEGFLNSVDATMKFQTLLNNITSVGSWFGGSGDKKDNGGEPTGKGDGDKNKTVTKNNDGTIPTKVSKEDMGYMKTVATTIDSAIRDGGLHAIFYTNYSGSVSDSFSNSVSGLNVGDKLKSVAKANRDIRFDVAGGNILGDTITTGLSYVKQVAMGSLDSVTYGLSSIISTLTGDAYIDLPKKWDDSDMNISSVTYTMQLRSPYGNFVSQLQNLYIPIAMLLAGTLPRATGKSSYTSPFLCNLYTKGLQDIKLGMITSLTITRGAGNMGYDKLRRPLGFDVSFTVTDFSTLLTAPVNGSVFKIFNVSLDDDTPLGRYIATLTARDLLTNKYAGRKFRLRASRLLMSTSRMLSPSGIGLSIGAFGSKMLAGLASDQSLALSGNNK